MAFSHGSKAKGLLNGYDLSSYLRGISFSGSLDTADASVMGLTSKQYVTGMLDANLSLDGVFDGAAGAQDEIISGIFDASTVADQFVYCPQGYATLGQPAYGFEGNKNAYEVSTPIGDVASWTAGIQSNVGWERGIILHPYQAEGAGGNTTGVDQTASTSNGASAYLQVASGALLAVKVQDSADNSVWADVAGLTFSTLSTRGFQRLAVTGTIRRYVRVLWTGTGTFAVSFNRK